jgi:hypothetical protein
VTPSRDQDSTAAPTLPFRLIAIAQSPVRIDHIHAVAALIGHFPLGVMLRDPAHDISRTRSLVRYAQRLGWPDSTTLISNSVHVDGLEWVHKTSRQLSEEATMRSRGEEEGAKACLNLQRGYSVHSKIEAETACSLNARYVMLSPIFPTDSKPRGVPLGTASIRQISLSLPVPVFALGGIRSTNIEACLDAGAYGIASISLFAPRNHNDLVEALELLERQ